MEVIPHLDFHYILLHYMMFTTLEINFFLIVVWSNGDVSQNGATCGDLVSGTYYNVICNDCNFIQMALSAILPTHSMKILIFQFSKRHIDIDILKKDLLASCIANTFKCKPYFPVA